MKSEKITILIPCHNEEQGIAKVLDDIPHHIFDKYGFESTVIVIDNNSSDRTREIAESKGAHVIFEQAKGKGNAMRKAFDYIDSDSGYVVMLDGDYTYDPREILRLIEPITNDFCDVVIGSRLGGKITKQAFKAQNRLANWIYTFLVRCFYCANITDVLSGYFAWRADVIVQMREHLKSDGFSIEMEMVSKMVKLGYSIYSVPISYNIREGETKLESIKDGLKILSTFFHNLFWTSPKEMINKQAAGLLKKVDERDMVPSWDWTECEVNVGKHNKTKIGGHQVPVTTFYSKVQGPVGVRSAQQGTQSGGTVSLASTQHSVALALEGEFLERLPLLFEHDQVKIEDQERIAELERLVSWLSMQLEIAKRASAVLSSQPVETVGGRDGRW